MQCTWLPFLCRIHSVANRALVKLDNLQKVELQFNRLSEFSLGVFENCTKYPNSPMTLNISHNSIRHLTPMNNNRVPFIQVSDLAQVCKISSCILFAFQNLDVSHNELHRIPRSFLEFLAPSLRILDISHNQVKF